MNKIKKQFDLDLFMEAIGWYSVEAIQEGAYSNEDMQTYITPGIFSVKIWSCETGEEKEWHVKRPMTLDEALNNFLPGVFPDSDWTVDEKKEIRSDYEIKYLGLKERDEVIVYPLIGLRIKR